MHTISTTHCVAMQEIALAVIKEQESFIPVRTGSLYLNKILRLFYQNTCPCIFVCIIIKAKKYIPFLFIFLLQQLLSDRLTKRMKYSWFKSSAGLIDVIHPRGAQQSQ